MLNPLDRAVHQHMEHGAMACHDPLTECLCQQMAPQPPLPDDSDDEADASPAPHPVARLEFMLGWAWGVTCGLCAGVCATVLLVLLYQAAAAAMQCPTC